MTTTVTIDDRFAEVLRTLGNLQEGAETAVKRYAIEQIAERIDLLREKCLAYETKYGCDTENLIFMDFMQWIQEHDLTTLRGS